MNNLNRQYWILLFCVSATIFQTCVAEITYDGYWAPRSPMPTPRSDLAATVIDNYVVLTGGCSKAQICPESSPLACICPNITAAVEVYYPDSDSWKQIAPLPRPRYRHGSELINNKLYIFGGRNLDDSFIYEIDVFDVQTQTWSTLPESQWLETGTSDFSSFVNGNTIYAVGGYTVDYHPLATSFSFSPEVVNATWNYDALPKMQVPRGDTCAAIIEDKIYLFGGFDELNGCEAFNTLEVFDFSEQKWTTGPSMPIQGGDKACGQLHGRFHVFGGEQKDSLVNCSRFSHPLDEVQEFDPADQVWRQEPSMPKPRFRFIAIHYDGNHEALYTFGGQADFDSVTQSYPVVDTVQVWSDFDYNAASSMGIHQAVLLICLLALFAF